MIEIRDPVYLQRCSNTVYRSNLIKDDEERSEPRGDELDADAEGDDKLVRGDGEKEVPHVGGLQEQEEIVIPGCKKIIYQV